ncbi:DEAD/DEAH box helicase family protein [Streptomyces sp. NPDC002888]|uniref:DEAD/DEAH box helicase family protein n=1 Tax=Streptomyces sp. NPDC002888 TaxID=3364668 RepID=UPI0036995936
MPAPAHGPGWRHHGPGGLSGGRPPARPHPGTTGAGKTLTAVTETYHLPCHAGARRILFLVDRNNLGRQARAEFDKYRAPDGDRSSGCARSSRARSCRTGRRRTSRRRTRLRSATAETPPTA